MINPIQKSEAGKGVKQRGIGSGDAFLKRMVRELEGMFEQRSEGNESKGRIS